MRVETFIVIKLLQVAICQNSNDSIGRFSLHREFTYCMLCGQILGLNPDFIGNALFLQIDANHSAHGILMMIN